MAFPGEVKLVIEDPNQFYIRLPLSGHLFAFPRNKFTQTYPNSILTTDLAEQPGEVVTFDLTNPMFTPEAVSWIWQFTQGWAIPEMAPPGLAEIGRYLNIDFFGAVSGPKYEAFATANPDLALLRFSDLENPVNYRRVLYYALEHDFPELALYTFSATDPRRHKVDDNRFLVAASYMGNYPIVNALMNTREVDPGTAKLPEAQFRKYSPKFASPFLLERFQSTTGPQALYYAILENQTAIVRRLLQDESVDPNADDGLAAKLAIDNRNTPLLQQVLPYIDLSVSGFNLLHYAVFARDLRGIIILLQSPDIDPTEHDNRLIKLAVSMRLPEPLGSLLNDPRVKDWDGEGLMHAIIYGFDDIIDILLGMKAEPEISEGAWVAAQEKGSADLMAKLLAYEPE
jgi:ankyrin repeat protein